jgi:hypothetical protein
MFIYLIDNLPDNINSSSSQGLRCGRGCRGLAPTTFLVCLPEFFHYMSATFSAALEFLFILVHGVDCLSNLADSAEFLFVLMQSVDCLSNVTDSSEYLFTLVHNVDCLLNLADSSEYLFILVHTVDCVANLAKIISIESLKECSVLDDIKANLAESLWFLQNLADSL